MGSGAYELKLQKTMHIHPVFHMSRLALYKEDSIPGRKVTAPEPLVVNGDKEFEIEASQEKAMVLGEVEGL